jgi:hypothetical protein
MDEIAELRGALDRLHSAFEDLTIRGLRSAGPRDLAKLAALRDEFQSAGAGHLAERLGTAIDLTQAGDHGAAAALLRAMTAVRLFDRMLTVEVAASLLATDANAAADPGTEAAAAEED